MDEPHPRRTWTPFAAGVFVGLLVGIPLGVAGLIVLTQVLTAMTSLP